MTLIRSLYLTQTKISKCSEKDGRTHNAKITTAPGGVARNMCEALRKLNYDPIFLSAIGDDLFGRELIHQFESMNIDHGKILRSKCSTAIYSALLSPSGECLFGLGDMSAHDNIVSDYILQHASLIEAAPIVILDANIPLNTISTVLKICSLSGTPIWFEPTEIRKAQKICMAPPEYRRAVSFMSPNIRELQSILTAASNSKHKLPLDNRMKRWSFKDSDAPIQLKRHHAEREALAECFQVFPALEMVLLTKGKDGIMITFKEESKGHLESFTYPAPCLSPCDIVSVSGAGDCLNAGFIFSMLQGYSWMNCARIGTECATQSLKSRDNVPDAFSLPLHYRD